MLNAQWAAQDALLLRHQLSVWYRTPTAKSIADRQGIPLTVDWLSRSMHEAQIVIWSYDMWEVAVSGAKQLIGTKVIAEDVPSETDDEFWYFADFVLDPDSCKSAHIAKVEGDPTLAVVYLESTFQANQNKIISGWHIEKGHTIQSLNQAELIACRRFTQLKLAAKEAVALPRPQRRRMERENQPIPDIRIIQLRARERGEGSRSATEYHHRWIVSGHWRRLSQPRKRDGAETTFVMPHVKGPDGAPLLKPRESVYVVAR